MTKSKKLAFRPEEYVVYPAHGVGQIISVESRKWPALRWSFS
jgi:CarD family transcriptional regulator